MKNLQLSGESMQFVGARKFNPSDASHSDQSSKKTGAKTKHLIYIYPSPASFIEKDKTFLSKKFKIITPKHYWNVKGLKVMIPFFLQFFFLIRYVPTSKVVIVMFAGYWSLLPVLFARLFRKKSYIILGGTDCVSFPEVNYGSLRKPLQAFFIKWSCNYATKLLPVHESLIYQKYSYYEHSTYDSQGLLAFFPNIKTPFTPIYNGFEIEKFELSNRPRKPNSFVTIALVNNLTRFKLKGLDKVKVLAEKFPNSSFTIIGIANEIADQYFSDLKNISCFPKMDLPEFSKILLETEFVLQLSISEGFPNTLCEAMLCGCIPIGSSVGAIPHIIGDTGKIITHSSDDFIIQQINEVLTTDSESRKIMSEQSRKRVIEQFPISKREAAFDALFTTI